jgi:hypothetical protein
MGGPSAQTSLQFETKNGDPKKYEFSVAVKMLTFTVDS